MFLSSHCGNAGLPACLPMRCAYEGCGSPRPKCATKQGFSANKTFLFSGVIAAYGDAARWVVVVIGKKRAMRGKRLCAVLRVPWVLVPPAGFPGPAMAAAGHT